LTARGGAVLLILGCALPARAEIDYRLKVQAGSEVDTNAERKEGAQAGRTDGVTRVLLRGAVAHRPDSRTLLSARIDVASKLFYHAATEDVFIAGARLYAEHRLSSSFMLAVDGTVKDRRERVSETAYFLGQGGASLGLGLRRGLHLRLRAGYGGFVFRADDPSFGYQGDDYSASLHAAVSRRLRLAGTYAFARRSYLSYVYREEPGGGGLQARLDPTTLRGDLVHTVDVRARYLRTVLLEGGYTFEAVSSNSLGFSYTSHRLGAQLSARLPGQLYLHVGGALRFLSFGDRIFLNTVLFIEDDNRNWVAVKVSREVGKGFALEATYRFYASVFAQDVLFYRRHVAGFGVAYAL
jgi:hypothetical protein